MNNPIIFTRDQVARLVDWQACAWVHPLTCAHKEDHAPTALDKPLTPTVRGLICTECGYRQSWAPDACLGPLPPDPAASLRAGLKSGELP